MRPRRGNRISVFQRYFLSCLKPDALLLLLLDLAKETQEDWRQVPGNELVGWLNHQI